VTSVQRLGACSESIGPGSEDLFGREVDDDVHTAQRGRPQEVVMAEGLVSVGRMTDAAPRQVYADDGRVTAEATGHGHSTSQRFGDCFGSAGRGAWPGGVGPPGCPGPEARCGGAGAPGACCGCGC
jgi:hypothetical protein